MTKRYDIEDEKFKSVIKSLKELPHLSAPADFEVNLRRKLNSLEAIKEEKSKKTLFAFLPGTFGIRKVLIPAGALAATAVIAFLIFNPKTSENPFMTAPQLRSSQALKNAPKENLLISPGEISSTDVVTKKNAAPKALPESGRGRLSAPARDPEQMALNDRLLRRIRELNMQDENSSSSGDIDRSLREKPSPYGAVQYGNGANTVNFEGFNIYQEGDRSLDMLRARMDSIRRMMRSRR
ncbi:MAG TPA: hypothetical protein VHO03_04180 [Ignavibacteriales bacterium]|nr:hypothetical protein [Ignavibacteriales bacterium]